MKSSYFQAAWLRFPDWPVFLGMAGIAVIPFLSIYRVGPQSGFFLEAGSLMWISMWVLLSLFILRHQWANYFYQRPHYFFALPLRLLPFSAWWLMALAAYWFIQARILNLNYYGMSDMVAGAFMIYALLACVCRAWVRELGQEKIVRILAWTLLIGACIQAMIGWLQHSGMAAHFSGILMYRHGIVEGQLGQRNHFAHYLMWGVLAASLLWAQRRMQWHQALVWIAFLGATMGLTGSRTIFAYLIGVSGWALLWLWGGRLAWRYAICFLSAVGMVLFMQFAIEPLLAWLGNGDINGAAERLSSHKFGQSGRDYEWQKAWQLFLNAPLLGHGWGSYSLQGFLLNIYPQNFRPYETNVLFTHSHNSFLNILAEMGILGLGLVLGGLAWIVKGCLKKRFFQSSPATLFLLSALTVSLAHSFLEYPLWYFYFLSVVVVLICLLEQATVKKEEIRNVRPIFAGLNAVSLPVLGLSAILALMVLISTAFSYQTLRQLAHKNPSVQIQNQQVQQLLALRQSEHFLQYYVEFVLSSYIDVNASMIPDWALAVAERANRYRPYPSSYKWALLAYRLGDKEKASKWLAHLYHYYPSKLGSTYGQAIMDSPYYVGLQTQYQQTCLQYFKQMQLPSQCKTSIYTPQNGGVQ